MYRFAIAVVAFLILVMANHPQAMAAELNQSNGTKTKAKQITNPNKTESGLNTRALNFSGASYDSAQSVSVYDVWFDMQEDSDGDGYYHRFDVNFDIDTVYNSQTIYVIAEITGSTSQTLFQTEPYTLNGNSGNDSYQVNVLLTEGYPAAQYELTLRIYDAANNELLLQYGAQDNNALYNLYLEDSSQEAFAGSSLSMYELAFELSEDYDADGYYTELAVSFDADTPGDNQWVYARVSLIDPYGQWRTIRTSSAFLLSGYNSSDRYSAHIVLDYGFDPETYQLAVELYDADNHNLLLTSTTPLSTPLHLESTEWDDSYSVIVEEEYYASASGGSTGMLMLTVLLALLILKRRYKSEK